MWLLGFLGGFLVAFLGELWPGLVVYIIWGGMAGYSLWVLYSAASSRWLACIGLLTPLCWEFYVSLSSYTRIVECVRMQRRPSSGLHQMRPDGEVYQIRNLYYSRDIYTSASPIHNILFVSSPIGFVLGAVTLLFMASRDRPERRPTRALSDPLVIPDIHDFTRQPHTSTAINPAPLGNIHAFLTIVRQVAHPPATDTSLSEPPSADNPSDYRAPPQRSRPRHTPARNIHLIPQKALPVRCCRSRAPEQPCETTKPIRVARPNASASPGEPLVYRRHGASRHGCAAPRAGGESQATDTPRHTDEWYGGTRAAVAVVVAFHDRE